jgi:hypothetical protein
VVADVILTFLEHSIQEEVNPIMFIRSTLVLAFLALPLMAQELGDVKAASTGGAATFYKAYFLDKDQSRSAEATKKALGLYQSFLAANPGHKLAGKAAANAVVLIYATGDVAGARAFAKKHSDLITTTEKAVSEARRSRPQPDEKLNAKLRDAMSSARDGGDDAESSRIGSAMRRSGGRSFGGRGGFSRGGRGGQQGGRGSRGGSRGGRGGRGGGGGTTIPKIAAMSKEDAKKAVDTFVTGMERMIDFMAQRGQADQADKLEAKLDKIQDLVDDGKLAEAQKILDSVQADMGSTSGRSRRGGGGEQGGRRRRGGDGGGAGTGERRRRGGDGGDAGAGTGERRRRRG